MAEVSQKSSKEGSGKIRSNKRSTRIDMTPMVDLAFLLLTFFILTTTFTKSHVMDLTMPDKGQSQPVNDENVLNLVLGENNKVYWFDGLDGEVTETNYSKDGVRKVLLNHKQNEKLIVLIKPMDECKYHNMIDILDEIDITGTKRYAIVDYSADDKAIIDAAKNLAVK